MFPWTSIPSPCFLVNKFDNNDIGYFHQNIFSYFKDCEVSQAGGDVIYRNPDGIQMPGPLLEDDDCACLLVKKPWKSLFVHCNISVWYRGASKIDNFKILSYTSFSPKWDWMGKVMEYKIQKLYDQVNQAIIRCVVYTRCGQRITMWAITGCWCFTPSANSDSVRKSRSVIRICFRGRRWTMWFQRWKRTGFL